MLNAIKEKEINISEGCRGEIDFNQRTLGMIFKEETNEIEGKFKTPAGDHRVGGDGEEVTGKHSSKDQVQIMEDMFRNQQVD